MGVSAFIDQWQCQTFIAFMSANNDIMTLSVCHKEGPTMGARPLADLRRAPMARATAANALPAEQFAKKKLKDFSTGRRPARLITALAR